MARVTPGNYVPLDVNYPHDAAIRRAGDAAEVLFIRSIAYAKRTRNGGFVPSYDLEVVAVGMRNVQRRVAALVREQLWIEADGGWFIRSWARWNPNDEARTQASHLGNHTRWHVKEGKYDPACELCQQSPPAQSATPIGIPNGSPEPTSPRESQGKGREGKGTNTCASADAEREFEEWYTLYPRKRGKGQALKAYRAARKKVDAATLLERLRQQIPALTSKGTEFVPYPATWLNGERWDDEADTATNATRGGGSIEDDLFAQARAHAAARRPA